jgi:hypothetical protein
MARVWLVLWIAMVAGAEVVDRLAVSVGPEVITEQQILLHLRIAGFLNAEPVKLGPVEKRQAAQKLIELALIRIEMKNNRYPLPTEEAVNGMLSEIARQRFGGSTENLKKGMATARLPEAEVREYLRWQLAVLSFIEFRFRPGVQITEEEMRDYYEFDFKADFAKTNPGRRVPSYGDARRGIEELITQQRIDNLLDRWLNQTESTTRVRWVEKVFGGER